MPVPSVITDLSQTAASNYPAGTDSPATLDDVQRAHASFIALLRDGKGRTNRVTLAGASTTDIGGQNSLFVEVTGTPTITSLGTSYNGPRYVKFAGALTLTHNATLMSLIGGTSITTAAGDFAVFVPNTAANGWDMVMYQRASGAALVAPGAATETSSGIVELATSAEVIDGTDTTRAVTPAGLAAKASSDTASGLVELATSAEVATGTDTTRAVTPAGLAAVLFAKGQTRYDRASSRAFGSTYTNTSNKARVVSVLGFTGGAGGGYIYATVDSTKTEYMGNFFTSGGSYPGVGRAIIQPGETYSVNVNLSAGTFTLSGWWEMDV